MKKKKTWKQSDIDFTESSGRVSGRFKDRELAKRMGSIGGAKGGAGRVKATTDEFRQLNSMKAYLHRWGRAAEWSVELESQLEEQRELNKKIRSDHE